MICAGAHFVIFTAQKGAAKGSARMQGISSKIQKNLNQHDLGKLSEFCAEIRSKWVWACPDPAFDWYLQGTACAIFAKEKSKCEAD